MSEPDQREEAVFEAARQLPSEQRAAYLDEACAGDPALRQRVEALLRADQEAGALLEPAVTVRSDTPVTEKPGDKIGRYKLLQEIGEGGCGVVYMAEQQEPVRRRVALKVIKLGMDTKQVIARFEAERQALALMDHPNIAKVLDAGATETGRPFFVMELVRGVPITNYCDENNLPMQQRLELFIQVCQAVQHAHQKGIIHRDIKPSNILVTVNDGVAVPKVIDFGIAKATTGQQLTDKTLFTAFEQFIGTPAYMSPEQAVMTSLDIDTRSDLYSLGVLLYELLTGKTPFDPKELLQAGFDEMRRTIREQEPAKPSTRLSTMVEGELTTTAKHRHTEPPKLIHLVRGDLDWIVMKCLEKDRTRRYETANGLAADIGRYLNNQPVAARPPTSLYRLQKSVRRNKLAFAAAAVVMAALVIGLAVSTWEFFKEKAARQRAVAAEREQARLRVEAEADEKKAQTEAAKSEQVSKFLKDMLGGVGPNVALGRDTTLLREILDHTAERVGKELKDQPEVEVELRNTLGKVYYDLGEYKKCEAMQREALAISRKYLSNEHPDAVNSLYYLACALYAQGRSAEAEPMFREALAMYKKTLGNEHRNVAYSLNVLGDALREQGKLVEAEAMHRDSAAMNRKLLGGEHPNLAYSLNSLAIVLHDEGKLAEAESLFREALAMYKKTLGNEHPRVAFSLHCLAWVLRDQGKLAEAEPIYREALAMYRKLLGSEHPLVAECLSETAALLHDQGRLAEAESMYREALAAREKNLPDDWQTFNARSVLGGSVLEQKRFAEAEPLVLSGYEGMRQRQKEIPAPSRQCLKEALQRVIQFYEATDRPDQAAAWKQKLAEFDKAETTKKADAPP